VGQTAQDRGQPGNGETVTDHAIKHARAQLQAARIPRPADPEALLATYLNLQRSLGPVAQLCACGCGQPAPTSTRGRPRKYIDETHRKRAQRQSSGHH
jgi:hypothetical protein